jgi:hypothetical protein
MTRIRVAISSRRSESVNVRTAAFVAQYMLPPVVEVVVSDMVRVLDQKQQNRASQAMRHLIRANGYGAVQFQLHQELNVLKHTLLQ